MWPDEKTNRFCVGNATLYAGVCFATMATELRGGREFESGNAGHGTKKEEKRRRTRLMYFVQAEEDEHLSAPVRRVYFPFSSLSVTATLGHNSLVARHCMDNVSKGLHLAL